ncbi:MULTISPECIES: LysR family transcriptional regulator [unclassified Amycolatopsis]|uniref:LysR family transcriptional regulator n=1 Tax=unclassified Amycolatopsis TaxID=2618356 RepID=UPI00287709CF|nr:MULTISPECIES: LysR family transcriptional regulator [unclassified Amycolatopsis]MDS0132925.1 LysR family transcriptional regulator [Amycolatopsis sp. 505]MDS0142250.1 LysR family transcriptional regulator [Amycolatopsis sp. CM201R]
MDLDAVRTFVAVVEAGRFQDAATDLSITQQAVSKRIAALEKSLGARLFTRTARGAVLTGDGTAFLPHARELLAAELRALASVRTGPLRVDVIGRRLCPATLLRGFHQAHPDVALEVATLFDTAIAALLDGSIDASFRAVVTLPADLDAQWVLDEPIQLMCGPAHPLANAASVTPAELAGHRIRLPGVVPGTEWGAYYTEFAAAFGLWIDAAGPNFGIEVVLDTLAESAEVATLLGAGSRVLWPPAHDLRRVPIEGPVPVYPHSLVWRRGNAHPGLTALRRHLAKSERVAGAWRPGWAA